MLFALVPLLVRPRIESTGRVVRRWEIDAHIAHGREADVQPGAHEGGPVRVSVSRGPASGTGSVRHRVRRGPTAAAVTPVRRHDRGRQGVGIGRLARRHARRCSRPPPPGPPGPPRPRPQWVGPYPARATAHAPRIRQGSPRPAAPRPVAPAPIALPPRQAPPALVRREPGVPGRQEPAPDPDHHGGEQEHTPEHGRRNPP